jgi:hypothetical protein
VAQAPPDQPGHGARGDVNAAGHGHPDSEGGNLAANPQLHSAGPMAVPRAMHTPTNFANGEADHPSDMSQSNLLTDTELGGAFMDHASFNMEDMSFMTTLQYPQPLMQAQMQAGLSGLSCAIVGETDPCK